MLSYNQYAVAMVFFHCTEVGIDRPAQLIKSPRTAPEGGPATADKFNRCNTRLKIRAIPKQIRAPDKSPDWALSGTLVDILACVGRLIPTSISF